MEKINVHKSQFAVLDALPAEALLIGQSQESGKWRIRHANARFFASTGWVEQQLFETEPGSILGADFSAIATECAANGNRAWSGAITTNAPNEAIQVSNWQASAFTEASSGCPALLFTRMERAPSPSDTEVVPHRRDDLHAPAKTASRLSDSLLGEVLRVAADAIVVIDQRQNIVEFNQGAESMFGYRRSDMLGRALETLIPPGNRPSHASYVAAFGQQGARSRMMRERGEITGIRRNGEIFPCQASIMRIDDSTGVFHAAILRDQTEIKRIEAELRDARDRAEQSNLAKDRFLATMSHELRTPLNAVIGFSDLIRNELIGPIENRLYLDYAADILDSGNHLLALINDMMDIALIDAETMRRETSAFDLRDVATDIVSVHASAARKKGLELVSGVPENLRIRADRKFLCRSLMHLVDNAIKFSEQPGVIEISVWFEPGESLSISVTDFGIGIPAELLDSVTDPFFQANSSHSRLHQGSGIGLSYVKRCAELHGGELRLAGNRDRGTTATLRLPASCVV